MKTINWSAIILLCLAFIVACDTELKYTESIEQAENYLQERDYRLAILTLKNILNKDPENITARLLLGKSYLPIGDGASAEKELRKTVELGMDSSSYVIPLAKAYLLQGKIEQAIQLAQPIEGADSLLNAEILVVQAEAYFAAHDLDKANFLYRNILSANPELVSALIGSARLNLAENNHEKTSLDLLKLKNIAPANPEVWELDGLMLAQLQKYQESEGSYQKTIELLRLK